MAQYTPRLAAIRLSTVENRSRPQLRIALRAHRLAAASGPPVVVAFTNHNNGDDTRPHAPVTLAAGLAASDSTRASARLIALTVRLFNTA